MTLVATAAPTMTDVSVRVVRTRNSIYTITPTERLGSLRITLIHTEGRRGPDAPKTGWSALFDVFTSDRIAWGHPLMLRDRDAQPVVRTSDVTEVNFA